MGWRSNDFTDIEDIIRGYGNNKPANAREIAGCMTLEEIMSNKELFSELRRIKDLVRSWNR